MKTMQKEAEDLLNSVANGHVGASIQNKAREMRDLIRNGHVTVSVAAAVPADSLRIAIVDAINAARRVGESPHLFVTPATGTYRMSGGAQVKGEQEGLLLLEAESPADETDGGWSMHEAEVLREKAGQAVLNIEDALQVIGRIPESVLDELEYAQSGLNKVIRACVRKLGD